MKRILTYLALGVLFLGFYSGISSAQEPPKVRATIRTFGVTSGNLALAWNSDGSDREVNVYRRQLSRNLAYEGDATVHFYARPPKGAPLPEDAAPLVSCKLSPKGGDYLLVFLEDPKTGGYRILSISEEANGYKLGMILFINFSKEMVAGALGEARFTIAPGKTTLTAFPKDADPEVGLLLKVAAKNETDQWRLIYQRPQFYRSGSRWVGFIFDNPTSPEGVEVRMFRDKLKNQISDIPIPPGGAPAESEIFRGPESLKDDPTIFFDDN